MVAVMIEEGPPNPLIDKLWEELVKAKSENKDNNESTAVNFDLLLPPVGGRSFFRYLGSLTTPPCTESVMWTVLEESVYYSKEQIEKFEELPFFNKIGGKNNRPVQPLHARQVTRDGAREILLAARCRGIGRSADHQFHPPGDSQLRVFRHDPR